MPSNDWGDSWASFSGFDIALEHSVEKTTRLTKFLSEKATAQIEYCKKLREIAQKHQQKFNQKRLYFYFYKFLLGLFYESQL